MKKIIFTVLIFIGCGCIPPSVVVQPENIQKAYYQVNKNDGISAGEAVAIARYDILTGDYPDLIPLKPYLNLYKVWSLESDEDGVGGGRSGYRVGFRTKEERANPDGEIYEWRVYVDDETGEVVNAFLRTLAR